MLQLPGTLKNEYFKSAPIAFWPDQNFKWAARVPLLKILPSSLSEEFVIKLYTTWTDFDQKEFIGMCKLKWKDCITFPNEWKVKTESDLIDPEQDSSLLPKNAKI